MEKKNGEKENRRGKKGVAYFPALERLMKRCAFQCAKAPGVFQPLECFFFLSHSRKMITTMALTFGIDSTRKSMGEQHSME